MKKSFFLRVKLVVVFIAAVFSLSLFAEPNNGNDLVKPNIVFIAIDDMNDWVGYPSKISLMPAEQLAQIKEKSKAKKGKKDKERQRVRNK